MRTERTTTKTAYRRAALETRITDLRRQIGNRAAVAIERHTDPMDQAIANASRDRGAEEIERLRQQLAAAQLAVTRIDGGTFGVCLDCEGRISEKRLDALPWALLCVSCQAKEDIRKAQERLGVEVGA